MNLAEKLLTAVGIMTDAAVQKAGYDKTVVATIATVDDLETKTYTVQYGDAQHTAKGTEIYGVGDQVYVTVPGNTDSEWQIQSLAQGKILGGSWVDIKDLPPDNLFVPYRIFNSDRDYTSNTQTIASYTCPFYYNRLKKEEQKTILHLKRLSQNTNNSNKITIILTINDEDQILLEQDLPTGQESIILSEVRDITLPTEWAIMQIRVQQEQEKNESLTVQGISIEPYPQDFSIGMIYSTDALLKEIKEKKRLYVEGKFTVLEIDAGSSRKDIDYGLKFNFTGLDKPKQFTINDMIGDPTATEIPQTQLGCLTFTDAEVDMITGFQNIEVYQTDCTISIADCKIYGTNSIDMTSASPVECRIYTTVGETQIQVTSSLLNDISDGSKDRIEFIAQMAQGSINLNEQNTIYQWQRYSFDWSDLQWKWTDLDGETNKTLGVTNSKALYPTTKFKCTVNYNGAVYESTEIQVKSANTDLVITPKMGENGPRYYVTLTAPDAIKWKIKNMPDGALIEGILDEEGNISSATKEGKDENNNTIIIKYITIDASLISAPLEIYATDGTIYGTISLANIGRESSNIEVLNVATYLYNLGGELTGIAPIPLQAQFYDPQKGEISNSEQSQPITWTWNFPESNTLLVKGENSNYGATQVFSLERYYDINKTNNTIEVKATYAGVTYIHAVTIGILRTGEPGTNGTDVICKIGVQHQNDSGEYGAIDYPAYEQVSTEIVTLNDSVNDLKFSVKLENTMNDTPLTVDPNNITWFKWSEPDQSATSWTAGSDIMCAKVLYNEKTYYAYLPIARYYGDDKLKEGSGFAHVMYQPNGTNPSYYQSQFESENTSNSITRIIWHGVAGINGTAEIPVAPPSTFSLVDGTPREISLTIALTKDLPKEQWPENATEIQKKTRIELPILFRYNTYGLAQVNAWDGSSITLADGAVMAPMAGFGSKDSENKFSGVLLGEVSPTNTDGNAQSRQGIFGQHQGKETFFLDSKDGSATFGMKGKGQIKFKPNFDAAGNNMSQAIIEGGNYIQGQSGMRINLSEPSIKWGNDRFQVGSDGKAIISGATFNEIANATITDSNGNVIPLAKEIIVQWQAFNKGTKLDTVKNTIPGWSNQQPSDFTADTHDLWQKIIKVYFNNAEDVIEYINTTGATGVGTPGRSVLSQTSCIYYFEAPASSATLQLPNAPTVETQPIAYPRSPDTPGIGQWYLIDTNINIPAVIDATKVFAAQCIQTIYSDHDADSNNNPVEYSAVTLVQSIANLTRWASENDQTLIDGGNIYARSIGASAIATDALRSINYRGALSVDWQINPDAHTDPPDAIYIFTNPSLSLKAIRALNSNWATIPVPSYVTWWDDQEEETTGEYCWVLIQDCVHKYGTFFNTAYETTQSDEQTVFVPFTPPAGNDFTLDGGLELRDDQLTSIDDLVFSLKVQGTFSKTATNPIVIQWQPDTRTYTVLDFPSNGTFFDLANGAIYSQNFKIDSNGDAYFRGNGTFSGDINVTGTNSRIGDFKIGSENGISFIKTGELTAADNTVYFGSNGLRIGSTFKLNVDNKNSQLGPWTLSTKSLSYNKDGATLELTGNSLSLGRAEDYGYVHIGAKDKQLITFNRSQEVTTSEAAIYYGTQWELQGFHLAQCQGIQIPNQGHGINLGEGTDYIYMSGSDGIKVSSRHINRSDIDERGGLAAYYNTDITSNAMPMGDLGSGIHYGMTGTIRIYYLQEAGLTPRQMTLKLHLASGLIVSYQIYEGHS